MEKTKLELLIVDDNKTFVDRMIRLLDELDNIGYIDVANSYDDAFWILTNEKPDLVLLDINLKGKSGIDLLGIIKKMEWECKVIMVSNHADEYYRRECKNLGADYFLDKTNDFGLLPGIIISIQQNLTTTK